MWQTPHLHLVSFVMESLMLVRSIVRLEPVYGDGGGGGPQPDETPSGLTPLPANSHPSGLGRSPLVSGHQRVPAHQHAPSRLPA